MTRTRKDFSSQGGIPEPTETLPGSEDRIRVLARRVAAGQQCFNNADTRDDERRGCLGGDRTRTLADGTVQINGGAPINTGKVISQPGLPLLDCYTLRNTLPKSFQGRLRILRKRAGLSQADLASLVGLHRITIAFYENGVREPGLATARLLAEVLKVTLDLLAGEPVQMAPQAS